MELSKRLKASHKFYGCNPSIPKPLAIVNVHLDVDFHRMYDKSLEMP